MRRGRPIAAVGIAVLVVAAVGLLVWPGHLLRHTTSGVAVAAVSTGRQPGQQQAVVRPGVAVPAAALDTARNLVTGTPDQQRAAVAPELASVLPSGTLFPSGAALTLDATGWHQAGAYANATGTLRLPGHAPQRVELGFTQQSGSWLVTFEAAAS